MRETAFILSVKRKFAALKISMQCPLVLLVLVGL